MAENLNTSLTVEAWAEITIKEWIKKIEALGIGQTGQLVRSFVHHINTSANGIPELVLFAFEYYGRFVDWGVGKGVTIEHRDMMVGAGAASRRQKPWYSDVFYKQLKILTHLMAEKYAQKAANVIVLTEENWSGKTSSGSKKSSGGKRTSFAERTRQEGYSVKDYKRVRMK
jgi:hypothetical protein